MRIGVLHGDGVGPEVVAEATKVLEATGVPLELVTLPWGSAYWHEHGRMMPVDGIEVARGFDAILLGAVGDPSVPDHVSLWGLLFALRQELDLWANVRPVKLLPGVPCPLAGRGPEDVDMLFVRENTEGEYSGVGGRVHDEVERVSAHLRALGRGRRGGRGGVSGCGDRARARRRLGRADGSQS